ncbi:MAG: hypothetical protein KGH53_01965 [Candidatus Micrarchaeota archaeon]|nr:hypothetical protein [Candidatus Micrarchaeota archaeon]
MNVPTTCTLVLSNSAVSLPATNPGGNSPLANAISSTNNGNIQGYLWISGSNWIGDNSAINFFVSNTIYSNSANNNGAGYLSNSVSLAFGNTAMLLPSLSTNTIYLGVNIPVAQTPNSYTQNIFFQTVC